MIKRIFMLLLVSPYVICWIACDKYDILWPIYIMLAYGVFLAIGLPIWLYGETPRSKKKKAIENDKALWFLRWVEPRDGEEKYLKDISVYNKDKSYWIFYQNQRRYFIKMLLQRESETGIDYISELHEYYKKKLENNSYDYNGAYTKIIKEMEKENITLMYIPGRDYIAIEGPVWADTPSLINKYNISDRVFIITHENIDRLVMDHRQYYDINKIKEGVNYEQNKNK